MRSSDHDARAPLMAEGRPAVPPYPSCGRANGSGAVEQAPSGATEEERTGVVVEGQGAGFVERAPHREPGFVAAPDHAAPVRGRVHELHEVWVEVAGRVRGAREVEIRPLAHVVHEQLL